MSEIPVGDPPQRLAYSIEDAVVVSGIGRTALYEAINSGELPARKRGRSTIILADDLADYLRALPRIGGVL